MKHLLIVGTGLTASSLSFLLSRATVPQLLDLTIWDKARGIGGRMASMRSNKVDGCSVDLGAQFFSITPEYATKHGDLYDLLMKDNVIEPLSSEIENEREFPVGTQHYVSPTGTSAVPKFFLKQSRANVNFRHQVSRIDLNPNYNSWIIKGQGDMQMEADAVVLTMPVPQVLAIKGNFLQLINADTLLKLQSVAYSPRYSLGLFFEPGTQLPGDWTGKYVSNNTCLRYIVKDHLKRGRPNLPPSLVTITGAMFGLQSIDAPPSYVQSRMVTELTSLLPDFPNPVEMKLQKWRYGHVFQEYPDKPGCVVLHSQPPLLLAGDAYSHTNCNGTIDSAKATFSELKRTLQGAFE